MLRTVVVGDIHGCYDELRDLLDQLALTADDRLVAVGDLTCKGEQSRAVLDLFISDPRFSSVIGNHDRALLRYWQGAGVELKPSQEKARVKLEPERETYLHYLSTLPYLIDLGTHAVAHAGVRPGVPLDQQSPDDLTELRTLGPDRTDRAGAPWYQAYEGAQVVLFGHWPAPVPRLGPRAIGLDTGCVYGFHLTAYVVEADQFVRVKARRTYEQPKK
ncbi:MAG: metallophosphoesterase [Pyrinomonadaceae bacterium]